MLTFSQSTSYCRSLRVPPIEETAASQDIARYWYAVFTTPHNEKSAAKYLGMQKVEAYLPTYETVRVWKNRQRVQLQLPLFPSYLFVRIASSERGRVLSAPGVLRIIGNRNEPIPVPNYEIDFLRSDSSHRDIQPYCDIVIGQRVRIKNGALQGLQGVLVRRNNNLRFVLTITLLNQHAAVEMNPENLEAVAD